MSTFRTRVLWLSTALSVIVVAAVMLSFFIVVTGSMEESAAAEAERLASAGSEAAQGLGAESTAAARRAGLVGDAQSAAAMKRFEAALARGMGSEAAVANGDFAVYDVLEGDGAALVPVAATGEDGVVPGPAPRLSAARSGESLSRHLGAQSLFAGVFSRADLGVYVVHTPFPVPDGGRWVLDAVYVPTREERVIDSVRPTMLVISLVAMIVTVSLMQSTLSRVLRLVGNLRVAAESIDSGELEVRLPDEGTSEVAELARSLNALIDRLRRRADAQTRFVADASHELATPVAGIRGYVNILRGWGADDPVVREEAVTAIDRESRRMARLTTQLLEMIRSEEVLELHSARHDINGVVRSVLEQAAARYAEKRLEFVGPDPGQLVVFGDPERLEDVLYILVDNAAKYTPSGGRVSVQTYRRKGDVVIEVSDTGAGIHAADLPSIFERFYRSDLSRSTETGGFGLGLSIAKRIVDTSGGLIDVRSQVGKGTTFTIRLPRGRD